MRRDSHATTITWMCDLCGPLWQHKATVPFYADAHPSSYTPGVGGEYERKQLIDAAKLTSGGRELPIPSGPVLFLCPACCTVLSDRVGPLKTEGVEPRDSD